MLTDADAAAASAGRTSPLRNLTPAQWDAIAERLPSGAKPTRETLIQFLVAANNYWNDAVRPSPVNKARLLDEAVVHMRAALEKLHQVDATLDLGPLTEFSEAIAWHADTLRDLVAGEPARTLAAGHRREFVGAAVELWLASGGALKLSRTHVPHAEPGGPLLRYLGFVCDTVMGNAAPAAETLAAFVREMQGP